jgi:hypothetical protein
MDIVLGNKSGTVQRKTEYFWLCACCAQTLHPEIEVAGNTVRLRLLKNESAQTADTSSVSAWVN